MEGEVEGNGKREKGNKKGRKKGKERGQWKKESLRKVGRTDGRTDTQVILYSVQRYAMHWTDNNIRMFDIKISNTWSVSTWTRIVCPMRQGHKSHECTLHRSNVRSVLLFVTGLFTSLSESSLQGWRLNDFTVTELSFTPLSRK